MGTILIVCGAMLVALAAVMVVGPAPIAQASHDANCSHWATTGNLSNGDMGAGQAVGTSGVTVTLTKVSGSGNNADVFTWLATGTVTGTYVSGSAASLGPGTSGTAGTTGVRTSNLIICAAPVGGASTTTTTLDGTTTTTLDGGGLCHWNEGIFSWNYLPGLDTSNPGHDDHVNDFDAASEDECVNAPPPDTTTTTTVAATTTTTVAATTTTTVAATTTTTVAATTTTTVPATTTTTLGNGTTTTVLGPSTTTTLGNGTTTTVGDGTTTTAGDGTTTTVLGPDEPTSTTAGGTSTSVLGPDDPELPNNGAGHLLAILLGGLGFVFMGSGSLVIATERRRLSGR